LYAANVPYRARICVDFSSGKPVWPWRAARSDLKIGWWSPCDVVVLWFFEAAGKPGVGVVL
jgi:hypothetical protein